MTTKALVNGDLLRWARQRRDQPLSVVANRLNIPIDLLAEWEESRTLPTIRQAQNLADFLGIPLGYLYLSTLPQETLPIRDLRTVGDQPARNPSAELSDVVDDAMLKQEWYRDYQESAGAEPLAFIGRYRGDRSVDVIAQDIRHTLDLTSALRKEAGSLDRYLLLLVRRAEDAGILVLRSAVVGNSWNRKLEVTDFRGFVISDSIAPLIFINTQDAPSARVFTLAHELAHLWIDESGVIDAQYLQSPIPHGTSIERLCSQIATEVLVPAKEFINRWSTAETLDTNIELLTRAFMVSSVVILRRAHELGIISYDVYQATYPRYRPKPPAEDPERSDRGNFYPTMFARNSPTFTAAVVSALTENRILPLEAARLLNVRAGTLPEVTRRVFQLEGI